MIGAGILVTSVGIYAIYKWWAGGGAPPPAAGAAAPPPPAFPPGPPPAGPGLVQIINHPNLLALLPPPPGPLALLPPPQGPLALLPPPPGPLALLCTSTSWPFGNITTTATSYFDATTSNTTDCITHSANRFSRSTTI